MAGAPIDVAALMAAAKAAALAQNTAAAQLKMLPAIKGTNILEDLIQQF